MLTLVNNSTNYVKQAYTTTNGVKTTEKYQHIQTDSIYSTIEALGYHQVSSNVSKRANDHSRHITRFEHPSILCEGVKPQLIVDNSHDGSRALYIRFGLYRVYCSNGLVIGNDLIKPIRIAHKGQAKSIEWELTQFVAQATAITVDMISAWSNKTLNAIELYSFIKAAHELRYGTDSGLEATIYYVSRARRIQDVGDSLWATYNRVQESLMHGTVKGSRRITSERRAVDFNNELNSLAKRYAA